MGAVTYPNGKVAEFITNFMVPIQAPSDSPLAQDFRVKWTPTIIVLDFYGREHHRVLGFLPPEEFIPALMLGMGKIDFDVDQFNDAILHFNTLLAEYPDSFAAPEAMYLQGVSRYKTSHNPAPLKEAFQQIKARYPASEWARRSEPYNLL